MLHNPLETGTNIIKGIGHQIVEVFRLFEWEEKINGTWYCDRKPIRIYDECKDEEKKGLHSGFVITQYTANALAHKSRSGPRPGRARHHRLIVRSQSENTVCHCSNACYSTTLL